MDKSPPYISCTYISISPVNFYMVQAEWPQQRALCVLLLLGLEMEAYAYSAPTLCHLYNRKFSVHYTYIK
jgi:hypothetical protein